MRINTTPKIKKTHEGAPAPRLSATQHLARSVMACMLWENTFYEDGVSIAERIQDLVPKCPSDFVMNLAVQAREDGKLRHVPLLLLRELARHPEKPRIADTLARVIQRADEPAEFLSLYWQDGKTPVSNQVKRGLGKAFQKFDAYQLAKYNRDQPVKLRDVLFMVHAKPKDDAQAETWKALADGTLPSPDTWEVALSAGADKKTTFTRLLTERKLGYLALLRNLRNMVTAGVDEKQIQDAILEGAARSKALPFRFIAAARAVPAMEPVLDKAMRQVTAGMDRLSGKTAILVDVSGSMGGPLSKKSDLTCIDAASALAVLIREIADEAHVFTFSDALVRVPPRRGMALVDAIDQSQPHCSTWLGGAVKNLLKTGPYDRLIIVTDEQSADPLPEFKGRGYLINVASYQNGIGYGNWTHIDGFSESVVSYIQAVENNGNLAEASLHCR